MPGPGPNDLKIVLDLLRAGQKIEAIKAYGRATGCGLVEAKQAVEDLARQVPPFARGFPRRPRFRPHYGNLSAGFLAFGIFVTGWGLWVGLSALGSDKWPTTEGVIVESRLTKPMRHEWRPKILYEYRVNGEAYRSERVAFAVVSGGSIADRVVERYPVGRRVTVYYNPNKPSSSALEPGIPRVAYVVLSSGLIFLGLFWWARRKLL